MEDTLTTRPTSPRRWVLACQAAAALAGLVLGYDFGTRISGTLLGVALAINAAVFCSMLVDDLADRFSRARKRG